MKKAGISGYGSIILIALYAGLFISCENQAFLPPYETAQSGEVFSSVKSGDLVMDGQSIRLSLQIDRTSDNPPAKLEIEVLDTKNRSLGVQILTGDELEQVLPEISIAGSEHGLHNLLIRLYSEQGELIQEERISFFKVDAFPVIRKIEVYPPDAVAPQASGVLIPSIQGGEQSWLRWTMGSDLLARGSFDQFREGFVWTAPLQEGVYSVRLEVFPYMPKDPESGFSFQSPVSSEVQFFVQARQGVGSGELGPDNAFRNIYHLRGSLQDSGYEAADILYTGTPVPAVRDGMFGYRITPADSLSIPSMTLADPITGDVQPFTLEMIWNPGASILSKRHIASFSSMEGKPLLLYVTDDSGRPSVVLPLYGSRTFLSAGIDISACIELSISFIPYGRDVLVKYYCNGRLVDISEIPGELFPRLVDSVLQIGGEKNGYAGFDGVIDELGIFNAPSSGRFSADDNIFREWAVRNFGERSVLYAGGFEAERDDILSVEGTVKIADILAEWQIAVVTIDYSGDIEKSGGFIRFSGKDGLKYDLPAGRFSQISADSGLGLTAERVQFVLRHEDESWIVTTPSGVELFRKDAWRPSMIEMHAGKLNSDGDFQIREVLITKERPSLVSNDRQQLAENEKIVYQLKQ